VAKRVLAVIDGNSLVHRAYHALPPTMTAPDGRPTNAVFGFVSMLVRLISELRPDGLVVAFDKGRPAFRTDALARYKIHRPPTPDDLRAQFPMVKRLLESLHVPVVEVDGWEGDDILGTLAERGAAAGLRVLLVTGDRDAFQLVGDDVVVVTSKQGLGDLVVYDADAVFDRYGVTPAQVRDFLGLKGDTSDNIPGVPGVGEKTAAKLIAEHGTLDAVLENAASIKGKLGENLREYADSARVSREVATIRCDVPIDLDPASVEWGTFDLAEAVAAFEELRFTSLVPRLRELVGSAPQHAAPMVETVRVSAAWPVVGEAEAKAALESCLDGPPRWVGAVCDDGAGESLFGDRLELVLAIPAGEAGVVGRFSGTAAAGAAESLFARGLVASPDLKILLHVLRDGVTDPLGSLEPARTLDCGVAAYLLESERSGYDVEGLCDAYLGAEVSCEQGTSAGRAHGAALLASALLERLEEDGSLACLSDIELPLVPVLVRMEDVGVGIDVAALRALGEETSGEIASIAAEIRSLAGVDDLNVDSPKQLGEVIFGKLGLPPGKRTKTGYSTDSSVLSALAPAYPIAERILAYRELTKLTSTYIDALPRLLGEDGRLHTTFNQTVAATGRLSSSNPNLQNIPIRSELGLRIRAAFVPAEPGDLMVTADYSQIELRILAHLSRDEGLIEAFTSGRDFHSVTASRVFGVTPENVTPEQRRRAKAVNFGIVYGQTAHGLGGSLGIGYGEAQAMIDRYFAAYPGVRTYLDATVAAAHRDGWAVTLYGRKRRIPTLLASDHNLRAFGERTAMNHPMQGTAADIMKLAMIEADRRLRAEDLRARMVLQVHDELVFEAPVSELEAVKALAAESMTRAAALSVPIEVNVGAGPDWASAK